MATCLTTSLTWMWQAALARMKCSASRRIGSAMASVSVDWQVMMFGDAVHSFCDPTVHAGPTRYDEKLCRKSYMLMRDFFNETL